MQHVPTISVPVRHSGLEIKAESTLIKHMADIRDDWRISSREQACTLYRTLENGSWERKDFIPGNKNSVRIDLKEIINHLANGRYDMIILCHYHPTGPTCPSETDLQTTRRIAQLCRPLDVQLRDHIIFGTGRCFSFRTASYL